MAGKVVDPPAAAMLYGPALHTTRTVYEWLWPPAGSSVCDCAGTRHSRALGAQRNDASAHRHAEPHRPDAGSERVCARSRSPSWREPEHGRLVGTQVRRRRVRCAHEGSAWSRAQAFGPCRSKLVPFRTLQSPHDRSLGHPTAAKVTRPGDLSPSRERRDCTFV